MREKWFEQVEFVASGVNDMDTEPLKLVIFNAQNGDLYLSICPESHRMGSYTMRIERSGGASTRNPRLVAALTDVYDAIAGNDPVVRSPIFGIGEAEQSQGVSMCESISDKIDKEYKNIITEKKRQTLNKQKKLETGVARLMPLFEKLEPLAAYGLEPVLHTDCSHHPCPAIHLKGKLMGLVGEYIGEIHFNQNGDILSGGCNMSKHTSSSIEEFLDFAAAKIAYAIAKSKEDEYELTFR